MLKWLLVLILLLVLWWCLPDVRESSKGKRVFSVLFGAVFLPFFYFLLGRLSFLFCSSRAQGLLFCNRPYFDYGMTGGMIFGLEIILISLVIGGFLGYLSASYFQHPNKAKLWWAGALTAFWFCLVWFVSGAALVLALVLALALFYLFLFLWRINQAHHPFRRKLVRLTFVWPVLLLFLLIVLALLYRYFVLHLPLD